MRKKPEKKHQNLERWIISYADFTTLLLATFVVMYAVSSINSSKFQEMAEAFSTAFMGKITTVKAEGFAAGHKAPFNFMPSPVHTPIITRDVQVKNLPPQLRKAVEQRAQKLNDAYQKLVKLLGGMIAKGEVRVSLQSLGVVIDINEVVLFRSGKADLTPPAQTLIDEVKSVLKDMKYPIQVNGFTDNAKIHTPQLNSNWDLSAARAIAVVKRFAADGTRPDPVGRRRLWRISPGRAQRYAGGDGDEPPRIDRGGGAAGGQGRHGDPAGRRRAAGYRRRRPAGAPRRRRRGRRGAGGCGHRPAGGARRGDDADRAGRGGAVRRARAGDGRSLASSPRCPQGRRSASVSGRRRACLDVVRRDAGRRDRDRRSGVGGCARGRRSPRRRFHRRLGGRFGAASGPRTRPVRAGLLAGAQRAGGAMSERADLPGASLSRWPIPELEAGKSASATDGAAPPETGSEAAMPYPNGADGAAHDRDPVNQIVAEEIARHRAEAVERGLAEGREQGYADGLAAGARAAEEAVAAQLQRLAAIANRLGAPIPALDRTVEEGVVALALEVARCVVGSEVERSREYLVRLIREAIAKVPIEMGALRLVLNPADLELVRGLAPDIESGGAVLVGDGSVEAGGCLVIADGDGKPVKDRRWRPRAGEGVSQVDLTLAARWRAVMLALFDGEEE